MDSSTLEQFRVYSDPARDARRHTVSVVFRVLVSDVATLHRGDDAKSVEVVTLHAKRPLSHLSAQLAFDHFEVLSAYVGTYHPHLAGVLL